MTEPRNKVVQVRRFGDPDGLLCAYRCIAGVQRGVAWPRDRVRHRRRSRRLGFREPISRKSEWRASRPPAAARGGSILTRSGPRMCSDGSAEINTFGARRDFT